MKKSLRWYLLGTCVIILAVAAYIGMYITTSQYFTSDFFMRSGKYLSYVFNNTAATPISFSQTNHTAQSIPVLLYHGIPDVTNNEMNVPTKIMEEHLFALKKAGYTTISIEQLYKYMRGEITLPAKSIVLSFDDGRIDSYNSVDPLLKALDFKAIMFAITRYSLLDTKSTYYLSPETLKTMQDSGRWEIESHSFDGHGTYLTNATTRDGHFFSHKMWLPDKKRLETDDEFNQRVQTDLYKSKEAIENYLHVPVIGFAYPFGDYGQNLTNFSKAKDMVTTDTAQVYKLAFYQNAPGQRFTSNYFDEEKAQDPIFFIKRLSMSADISGDDLIQMLLRSEAKDLPYTDNFTFNKGWLSSWGTTTFDTKELTLSSDEGQTGASTILDGSHNWKDYEVTASVSSPHQNGVYTWVRYKDDNNNAGCNLNNGFLHIEQTVNGNNKVIKGINDEKIKIPDGQFTVGARVVGRTIECSLNGEVIVSTPYLDPSLQEGGIGFKTWSPSTSSTTNTIILHSLQVSNN